MLTACYTTQHHIDIGWPVETRCVARNASKVSIQVALVPEVKTMEPTGEGDDACQPRGNGRLASQCPQIVATIQCRK
jgi:hypothetical protein